MLSMNGAETNKTHKSSRRHSQFAWIVAEVALGLVLVFSPLAVASVYSWAVAIAAVLAFLALGLTVWATKKSGEPFLAPASAIVLLVVTGWIAFQLVPLPPFLVGLFAHHTRELFEFVLSPIEKYPSWRALSLDTPATARELVKAITYVAVFLSAIQIARSRRAKSRIVALLGCLGIVVALIGFGHSLAGAKSLFGFFSYQRANSPLLTTFGNSNHLAAFLALTATLLLARVLAERDRKIATLWAFGYLVSGLAVFLTLSRGGILAFVATQIMLGLVVHRSRQVAREGRALNPRVLIIPAATLLVLVVAGYVALDALSEELATIDSMEGIKNSKMGIWPSFWPMIKDHWLTGVGRGAFEPAFHRFQDQYLTVTLTNPESLPFQWITELGLPLGLFFLGAIAWLLVQAIPKSLADVEKLACVIGLIGVGLHELVDFGLELGGLAVPAIAALAIATTHRDRAFSFPKRVVAIILPAAVLVTGFAFSHSLLSLEEEGKKLAQQFGNKKAASFEQEAKDIITRHPADYYLQLLVAQAFAEESPLRTDKLVEYANRAMFLKPMLAQPHRLAAMALRYKGWLTQAKIEYRLALQLGDFTVLPEITQVFANTSDMEEAVAPPGIPSPELKEDTQAALLSLAAELIKQKRAEESEAVAHSALNRCGESLPTLQMLARIASMRKRPEELHHLGKRMSIIAPESPEGLHTRVRAAIMKSDLSGGLQLLEEEGLAKFPHERSVLVALASLRLRNKDTKGGREILHRLITTNTSQRLEVLSLEARAAEIDGQLTRAVTFLRTGVQLRPRNAGWRWRYAAMLERVGKLDQAWQEAEKVAEIAPVYAEPLTKLKARIAEKKQQLLERKLWNEVSSGDSSPAN